LEYQPHLCHQIPAPICGFPRFDHDRPYAVANDLSRHVGSPLDGLRQFHDPLPVCLDGWADEFQELLKSTTLPVAGMASSSRSADCRRVESAGESRPLPTGLHDVLHLALELLTLTCGRVALA